MARPLKPRTPLAERLIEVREKLGFKENRSGFAEDLELLPDTLGSYERGVAAPSPEVLARYHKVFGVNISWLVSGQGPALDDPSKAPAPSTEIDPLLMEALYKAVDRAYRDVGQRPPGHRIANAATTLFNVLLSRVRDVRDKAIVDAAIPVLAAELVEKLAQAELEPGTGKVSGTSS